MASHRPVRWEMCLVRVASHRPVRWEMCLVRVASHRPARTGMVVWNMVSYWPTILVFTVSPQPVMLMSHSEPVLGSLKIIFLKGKVQKPLPSTMVVEHRMHEESRVPMSGSHTPTAGPSAQLMHSGLAIDKGKVRASPP